MALTATIYNFDIQLSDVDRRIFESLSLRLACHPSETEEYLVTRVLAYCLEYTEGIAFGKGLSEPNEAAITVRDISGALASWIEIGSPDAGRLHRASKASPRVAVYTHKDGAALTRQLSGSRIHRAEFVEIYGVDRSLLTALVARLDRRTRFDLAVTERHLYATINGETIDGAVERFALPPNDR